jgi:hypothetical protein
VGTGNAVGVVSWEGGYYKNPKFRIPFLPGSIQKAKKVLGAAGYGKEIDYFDLSMHRAGGKYVDRPTFTFGPVMGDKFARSLMAPIPPPAILSLLQAARPRTNSDCKKFKISILYLQSAGLFSRCGQWHASFTFGGPKRPPRYGISPDRPKISLTEFAVLIPFDL